MKNIFSIILVLFSLNLAHAALDEKILVQGTILDSSDKTNIKITDNNGQKVILPRSAFPKKFDFRQGKYVSIEVTDKVFDSLNQPVKKKSHR